MKKNYSALACLISASLTGIAGAQELSVLDEIVVTSSRVPLMFKQVATSISILSEEEIAAHGNLSLITVLRQLPGISTGSNGGAGSLSTLRVRGEETFRTLTMIDGIRIGDPSGTQVTTQMEHLLSSGIGRVEVLRGPQGLAYGADAGGIINISSPTLNAGTRFNAAAQTGAFGTQVYSGSFIGANENGEVYLQGVDFSSTGFNSRVADSVLNDNDGYDNQTLHTRLAWNASDAIKVQLVHRNVSSESEFDGCFDPVTFATVHACTANYDLSATRLNLEYNAGNMNHSLSYANSATDRENFTGAASGFTAEGELSRWEYLGALSISPATKFVFGGDHEQASNNDDERNNVGAHVEYLGEFSEALFVTAGLRYDDNDDFGQHTSYRVSAAYLYENNNAGTIKFRGSIGTGFRAPSPYESAYNQGPFSYPPASTVALQEETSKGYEVGVEYFTENLFLQAVYFNQAVNNAILFDLAGFSGYLQDVGESKSTGIELSGELSLNQSVRLSANYTFNKATTVSGLQSIRRPKHLANLGVMFTSSNERFNVNAFYRLSQDAEDEVFGTRVNLDDFAVLDFNASYLVAKNIELFGRIENALDDDYQEISGFNTAARAAYVGIKYQY